MPDLVCIILTSHRMDCFWLCINMLERHTDLRRFKFIYILANDVSQTHKDLIVSFSAKHEQVVEIHCAPRGLHGCVVTTQNMVLSSHREDIIVKIDEDVFVSEGWLDGLLDAYKRHEKHGASLVTPVVPNNYVGRSMLHAFLDKRYGELYDQSLREPPVHRNKEYGVWIWRQVLNDGLETAIRSSAADFLDMPFRGCLNINCVLFGRRLMDACLPFEHWDEAEMNGVLAKPGHFGIMTAQALAHHYSFGPQQEYIDQEIGMEAVVRYCRAE